MTKVQFLMALQRKLHGLPQEDIEKTLEYYNEMIDDRMEDGLTEQEAVAAIGDIDEIAQQILGEMPFPKRVAAKLRPKRKLEGWEIALLIIGAPIWLSLFIGLASGLFSTYMGVWAIIISLYATGVALVASAVGGVLAAIIFCFTGQFVPALFVLGCGLACGGLSFFIFMGGKYTAKGTIWVTKKFFCWIGSLFSKKEVTQ